MSDPSGDAPDPALDVRVTALSARKRRGLLLLAIGGMFLVLAIASGSPLGYLGAAIIIATAAAVAAGLPGFRGRD